MAPIMASLLIVSGSSAGDYFLLGRGAVVIGRDDDCPIQIVDDAVSRRHLQIRHDEPGNRSSVDLTRYRPAAIRLRFG